MDKKYVVCPHCGKKLFRIEKDSCYNNIFVWCKTCRKEINVRKEVDLTVDWYNMPEAEIPEKYNDKIDNENQKYDLLGMIDATNKTINLNFNITVQEKGNISKLQKSCIEGRLPELNGYAPTSVKVEGVNVNYTYDDSTRLLSAYKEAVLNSNGNVIKQCQKNMVLNSLYSQIL